MNSFPIQQGASQGDILSTLIFLVAFRQSHFQSHPE